jgi:translation initiation factor 2 subunit 1
MSRFYESQFPQVGDLIVVRGCSVSEMGMYVQLLEYDNVEGLICMSEISRQRVRSTVRLLRLGQEEVVKVMRTEMSKQYIDLSKAKVDPVEIAQTRDRYRRAKIVQSILKTAADKFKTTTTLEEICRAVSWPLYQKFGNAYTIFERAVKDGNILAEETTAMENPNILLFIREEICRRLKPVPVKMQCVINVACLGNSGVLAVRSALMAGQAIADQPEYAEHGIRVSIKATPEYMVSGTVEDRNRGLAAVGAVVNAIQLAISKERGGRFSVAIEPHVVGEKTTTMGAVLERVGDDDDDDNDDSDESEDEIEISFQEPLHDVSQS